MGTPFLTLYFQTMSIIFFKKLIARGPIDLWDGSERGDDDRVWFFFFSFFFVLFVS
mgnify:CR=1 FL=1